MSGKKSLGSMKTGRGGEDLRLLSPDPSPHHYKPDKARTKEQQRRGRRDLRNRHVLNRKRRCSVGIVDPAKVFSYTS